MDRQFSNQPKRPSHIPNYADVCLQAVSEKGLGETISLGGAFGLLHYLDYRATNDVDAWWEASATSEMRQQLIDVVDAALKRFGKVRQRAWGDVISIELLVNGKKVFSFQVAQRSVQLQPSIKLTWTMVQIDSFADLVASKMMALIDRGAPRDFRDIYAICQAGLTTPRDCWMLWEKRQLMTNQEADFRRAQFAIETHLERIEQHRPLGQIGDQQQRAEAAQVRQWFRSSFNYENVD
jgi:hypothetical protein